MNRVITDVDCLCGVVFGMSSRYELMNYQLSTSHIRFEQWVILCIVLLLVLLHTHTQLYSLISEIFEVCKVCK